MEEVRGANVPGLMMRSGGGWYAASTPVASINVPLVKLPVVLLLVIFVIVEDPIAPSVVICRSAVAVCDRFCHSSEVILEGGIDGR